MAHPDEPGSKRRRLSPPDSRGPPRRPHEPSHRSRRDDRNGDRRASRSPEPPRGPRNARQRSPPRGPRRDRSRSRERRPKQYERDKRHDDMDFEREGGGRGRKQERTRPMKQEEPMDVNRKFTSEEEADQYLAEQNDIVAKMMRFEGFRTTKNSKVPGNDKLYAVKKEKKTEYRQYMNRVGGFNRPLSPTRTPAT